MDITGKIITIGQTEMLGKDATFAKRQIVVEEIKDKYPQKIAIEFIKEKTDLLDNYKVGQTVTVDFNLKGSEWKDKFYVSLQGWKIKGDGPEKEPQGMKNEQSSDNDDDGLPF